MPLLPKPLRTLGDLESKVMDVVWAGGEVTARAVWEQVCTERPLAFNTVLTVMNRLVEKGLLTRSGTRRHYRFSPALSRAEFARRVTGQATAALVQDFGAGAVAEFVAALDRANPEYLELLERMIAERKRKRGEP